MPILVLGLGLTNGSGSHSAPLLAEETTVKCAHRAMKGGGVVCRDPIGVSDG